MESPMAKKQQKKKSRKTNVTPLRLVKSGAWMTVGDLTSDLLTMRHDAEVYVDIGGPMIRARWVSIYPKGIEGKPTCVIRVRDQDIPQVPTPTKLARLLAEVIQEIKDAAKAP